MRLWIDESVKEMTYGGCFKHYGPYLVLNFEVEVGFNSAPQRHAHAASIP